MSTPVLFVLLPGFLGLLAAALRSRVKWLDTAAAGAAGLLALLAFLVPIDDPWVLRGVVIRIGPAFTLLGRALVIDAALIGVVGAIYAAVFVWFIGALLVRPGAYLIPFGLLSTSVLVAAASVQPWGFVGIFLLVAVLLWVPLLSPPGSSRTQSVMNFLGFQVIGVPFLLIAGAMINGLETTPPGLRIVERPAIFLGLGFALILGLFPFHAWIPRLMEEVHPYAAAFVLAFLPAFSGLIFLQVVDQHVWLRSSSEMFTLLRTIGIVTVSVGGLLAAFQRHLGRILGFSALVETGIILLAIGSGPLTAASLFFPLLVSRVMGFMVWGSGLAAAKEACGGLGFREVQGLFRRSRFVGLAILAGSFSSAGLPILMGFLTRLRLYAVLSQSAPTAALAIWFASLGLLFATTRSLAVLVMRPDGEHQDTDLESGEINRFRNGWILAACLFLVAAGLFPFWFDSVVEILPLAFEHLQP